MVSLYLLATISTILFGFHNAAEAIGLGYGTTLSNLFESQDVEGSAGFIDYKVPKDKTKFVRKRILDTEGPSPESKETENIRSLETSDLDSFWIEENYYEYSLSYSYSYSYSYGTTNQKMTSMNNEKKPSTLAFDVLLSTEEDGTKLAFDLDSFWEEENYYTHSLSYSYSYSYSYGSNSNNKAHETAERSITSIPSSVAEIIAENESTGSTDVETVTVDSNNLESISSLDTSIISPEQSSVGEKNTMPSIATINVDDNEVENVLATPTTGEKDTTDATNAESVIADGTESISSLAKTMIGLGVGFTVVAAFLMFSKRFHQFDV